MQRLSTTYRGGPLPSIATALAEPDDAAPVTIKTSHQRSQAFGLSPTATPDSTPMGKSDLSLLIEQNRMLHMHAIPAMEALYQQIVSTHSMVILTDTRCVIVHSLVTMISWKRPTG